MTISGLIAGTCFEAVKHVMHAVFLDHVSEVEQPFMLMPPLIVTLVIGVFKLCSRKAPILFEHAFGCVDLLLTCALAVVLAKFGFHKLDRRLRTRPRGINRRYLWRP